MQFSNKHQYYFETRWKYTPIFIRLCKNWKFTILTIKLKFNHLFVNVKMKSALRLIIFTRIWIDFKRLQKSIINAIHNNYYFFERKLFCLFHCHSDYIHNNTCSTKQTKTVYFRLIHSAKFLHMMLYFTFLWKTLHTL